MRAALIAFLGFLAAGCGPGEEVPCTTSADCEHVSDTPSCDARSHTCVRRCVDDQPGRFVCVDGDRVYFESP